jgi:hypothetical protein
MNIGLNDYLIISCSESYKAALPIIGKHATETLVV